MTDLKQTVQQLGPDAMEALVRELYDAASNEETWVGFKSRMIAAARKLAEPEPVKPVWPSGKLWALFEPTHGWFVCVNSIPQGAEPYHLDRPCRVVPADAVVLTREEAEDVWRLAYLAEQRPSEYRATLAVANVRAAIRREREDQ